MWLPQRLLALALLPLAALAQSNTSTSRTSGGTSATNSGNTTAPPAPSLFTTTITDFSISGTVNVPLTTRTVIGVVPTTAAPSSTSKKPTATASAPTNVSGGGGADGIKPVPGISGGNGIYGPDDNYISAASLYDYFVLLSRTVAPYSHVKASAPCDTPSLNMSQKPRRVLVTNDDGPPGKESPYVFGLYLELTRTLGWDVKVVLPSSQKSWIGKAFQIKDTIKGRYYYPREPDGKGETSEVSRPLKEGEVGEWILLDATPATCSNIAIHNLYRGEIDFVISGPNFGRNSSSAFSLSSGTIGAAMSAALCEIRAIALSYGSFHHPTPVEYYAPAHTLSIKIIQTLWNDWGKDQDDDSGSSDPVLSQGGPRRGEVDLYNVNLPMTEGLLQPGGMKVAWTRIWRNAYGQLFKPMAEEVAGGGPDADATPTGLTFRFSPQFQGLVAPQLESLPVGTDGWAIHSDMASVTPLRTSFAEPGSRSLALGSEWAENGGKREAGRLWKL